MNIDLIPRSEREPEKSGRYLVTTESSYQIFDYSCVHNAWNVKDENSKEFAAEVNCNAYVTHWAYLPDLKGATA